jgi:hypothetical protein
MCQSISQSVVVCHTLLSLPFTLLKKYIFAAKEDLWKLKYFTMQKHNLPQKKSF